MDVVPAENPKTKLVLECDDTETEFTLLFDVATLTLNCEKATGYKTEPGPVGHSAPPWT